jgi:type IV pilus assembly protein PilC
MTVTQQPQATGQSNRRDPERARSRHLKRRNGKGTRPPRPSDASKRWYHVELTPEKVKPEQLMNFSRQCSSFVQSGIPILEALRVLTEDAPKRSKLTLILQDVAAELQAGASFSGALAPHAAALPTYYLPMLRSAELTGRLDEVLDQIATYMDRDIETRRKIKSAMSYPAVIGVMSVLTVIILSVYVLPRFKTFFEGFDAKLPLPTRMLVGFTNFMSAHGLTVVLLLVGVIAAFFAVTRFERGKYARDAMLLRIPKVGGLIHLAIIERFSRILSVMVTAGVPLPDAVEVAADTSASRPFRQELGKIRTDMIRGTGLSDPIAASPMFPPAARQMIRVGEATGTLDFQLVSASHYYGRELEYKLKRFTDLFEPAMIIFMGIVVGFVAIALVSAMYGVFNQVDV